MLDRILDFFVNPTSSHHELKLIGRWLRSIFIIAIGLLISYALVAAYLKFPPAAYIFIGTFLIMFAGLFVLLQKGHARLASLLFCLSAMGILLYSAYRFGGVRSPSYNALIIVIILSGVFLRGRITAIITALTILSGVLLLTAELNGMYRPDPFYLASLNSWLSSMMIFIMAATLLGIAAQRMRMSLHQATEELADRRRTEAMLRRQTEYLTALHETTLSIINRLEPTSLLDSILSKAEELLETEHSFIDLALPDQSGLQRKIGHGAFAGSQEQIIPAGQGMAGSAFVSGKTILSDDYRASPFSLPLLAKTDLRAAVSVPMILRQQVIGVIGLAHTGHRKKISADQVELLERFAELAGLALDNARLYQAAQTELIERTLIEDSLFESKERLRLALDAAHMGIWDWDIKADSIVWSEQVYAIFGRASKAFTGSYENFIGLILPADRKKVIQRINENLNHPDKVFHVEFRIAWPDGSSHWLEEKGRVYYDADRKPTRIAGTVTDITDRKIAEKKLTRANQNLEQYTTVLEQRSAQLRVAAEVSRAASEILDPTQLSQQVVDLVCKGFRLYYAGLFIVDETNKWAILNAASGEAGKKMLKIGHKLEIGNTSMVGWCIANRQPRIALDVGEEAVRFNNPLLPDTRSELALPLSTRGQMIGALSIQSDQEAAFSKEEIATFQTMADQLANAILNARLYDQLQQELKERKKIEKEIRQLNIGLANRIEVRTADLRASEEKFRALTENNPLQITRYDQYGRYLYLNRAVSDNVSKHKNLIGKTIREVVKDSRFVDFAEQCIRQVFETGQPLKTEYELGKDYAAWWLAPEFDADGKVISVIASTMNITERKRMEEELQQRSIELQAANKELEAFSYSVSHDLRAPLRAIDGFSHIVVEDFKGSIPAEANQYLQRISEASAQMGQLIDDMLRLSRITRTELHLYKVNLSEMATSIITELQNREPARKIKITVENDLSTMGDERLLRVALENLLNNAWKFTMKKKDAQIRVGRITREKREVFYVKDNGVGFDMAYSDKLFGVFQRLHTVEDFPGTGIGLAIVQRVIHKHGGKIWANSKPDKGTTFYFML
jgi:PAS domain S-box-containing protein